MIINGIRLSDFGPYGGEQELNLKAPQPKTKQENIFLIGGMNGAGKSSIFKAIQICLYGQAALGPIVSRRAYEEELRNLIHQGSGPIENRQASVGVDFTISIGGERADYFVKRIWNARTSSISETVEIKKNGLPIDGHEQRYWQDFIQHLIPQGLLNLFFFDGERINALIQSDESTQLAESIQALFGLNVIRQLRADLRYIERKWADHSGRTDEFEKLIDGNEKLLKAKGDQLNKCLERKASLVTRQENLSKRLLEWRRKLNQKGGSTGTDPEELQRKLKALAKQVEEKSGELKQLFQGALPFCFAKEYMGHALSRLSEGASEGSSKNYARQFERNWIGAKSELSKLVKEPKSLKRFKDLLCPSDDAQVEKGPSDLGAAARKDIQQWFQNDAQESLIEACRLVDLIEGLSREEAATRALLEVMPESSDISGEIDQVNHMSRELGAVEAQLLSAQEEEAALGREIGTLTRTGEGFKLQLDKESLGNQKTALTAKAILALTSFEQKLVETKIGILEKNFVACFNGLMRKGDVVSSIQIDPTTFAIKLIGATGREVQRAQLSEGEKQIFAIALLHAITRTSKCPFPIILDTPLGRLDSVHRDNIVNNYLPQASHQVLVLSTDTEIDQALFSDLKPYINKSFILHYEHQHRRTEIREGYFAFGAAKHASITN